MNVYQHTDKPREPDKMLGGGGGGGGGERDSIYLMMDKYSIKGK